MAWTRKYYLKNNYLTSRVSKEGVSMLYMDFNYVSPSNEGRHIGLI
jgi:hypothetical protein